MADKWGQFDNSLSGGADIWDDGLVGKILTDDYFEIITSNGQRVRVWTGTGWQDSVITVWDGTQWIPGVAKVWNGSAWV